MRDDADAARVQRPHRLVIDGKGIAAADIGGRRCMDGLQPELDPDGFFRPELSQQRQDLRRQTVRPRGDGERADLRLSDRGRKQRPQDLRRGVGIGKVLKIGDIACVRPGLGGDQTLGLRQLLRDREGSGRGKFSAAAAEDASARANRPVPVRAGAAGGERQLIDLAAKGLTQIGVQTAIKHDASCQFP